MKPAITFLLCLALAQCGLSPAWADAVTLPEAPPPAVEPGGPATSDLAASAPIGTDLAMLYHVPADGSVPYTLTPAAGTASPLTLQAATGADTRLGVDLSAANSASEGWPWYGKAALVVGCVLVAGVAAWAIVEATNDGSHNGDSSSHLTVVNNGQEGSVNVTYSNSGGGNSSWQQDNNNQ